MKKIIALLITMSSFFMVITPASAQVVNLIDVYEQAVSNDPLYRAAQANYRAQREARPQAWANLMPTIAASGNYTHIDFRGSGFQSPTNIHGQSTGYALTLQQPLFNEAYWATLKQSDAIVKSATAALAAAEQDLMIRVAEAYFNVLQAHDQLDVTKIEKTALHKQLEQAQQKFDVGLATITELKQAQAAYDLVVAQEITDSNQINNRLEELRQITGQYYEKLIPLQNDVPLITPEPADINQWTEKALVQNYALKAAIFSTQAARDNISIQNAGHMPTLTASASVGRTSGNAENLGSLTSPPGRTIVGVVNLNIPLFQGGKISSQARQARYQYDAAFSNLEGTRRQVINNTRQFYLAVVSGASKVKADKQAIVSGKSALESTQVAFSVGTNTLLDVLQRQRDLYAAQRKYANDIYVYVTSTLLLKQAAGTLSRVDLEQINQWLKNRVNAK